jgi:phospholipid:diacylglycerol acyltransferase
MIQNFLADRNCWLQHLKLNATTGLDPEGVKLRAASGFEAADYLIGSYWVWARLITNLADVGYDSSSMFMFSYDWRLAPNKLEERDGYFTVRITTKQHPSHFTIVIFFTNLRFAPPFVIPFATLC